MSATQPAPTTTLPNLFPFMRYQDASAAIDWLVNAFGFEPREIVRGLNGIVEHAELALGPGVIMLGTVRDDVLGFVRPPRELGGVTQGIYVCLSDVDSHYERARAAGAEIVRELADTHYGSREYCARDLEGHLWSFGTYRPPTPEGER